MTITNKQSGTNVHEIADRIYRINTPVVIEGAGGFSLNQYLLKDEEPELAPITAPPENPLLPRSRLDADNARFVCRPGRTAFGTV